MIEETMEKSSFEELIDQHLAKRLVEKRKELGIGLEIVSMKLNIPLEIFFQYEKGLLEIPAIEIVRISALYGVNPDYFFENFQY